MPLPTCANQETLTLVCSMAGPRQAAASVQEMHMQKHASQKLNRQQKRLRQWRLLNTLVQAWLTQTCAMYLTKLQAYTHNKKRGVASHRFCVCLPGRYSCNHICLFCMPGLYSRSIAIGHLHASDPWQLSLTWHHKPSLGWGRDDRPRLRPWLQKA